VNVLEAGQATLSDHFTGRALEGAPEPGFELVHDTPLVEGALAHLVARVVRSYWGGDHSLFLGQVEFARYGEGRPLLFHGGRYERLVEDPRVFSLLPPELLDPILALGEERIYADGEAIMRIGEAGAELLLVVDGMSFPVFHELMADLGRRGWIGGFLHNRLGFDIVFTWRGVVVAMAVMCIPLLVRTARVAFEGVNPRLEQIGRTLGASEGRVFFTITLPLAARGILGGVLLAFARALGEFGATILVAGNIPGRTSTLSLAIYQMVQLGHDEDAFRLLGISVAIAFLAVWGSEWLLRQRNRSR
jgi:molybdate transport system permease protein